MSKKTRFDEIAEELLHGVPSPNDCCQDCANAYIEGWGFRPEKGICAVYNEENPDYRLRLKPGSVLFSGERCEYYIQKTEQGSEK